MTKKIKKIIIIVVYIFIFSFFGYLIYNLAKPEETCFDGKKNQNERQVDCGGVCEACEEEVVIEDLRIEEKHLVYGGDESYDVLLKVSNPNDLIGGSLVEYEASILDEQGNVIDSITQRGFILPIETKYVVILGLNSEGTPASLEVEIANVEWKKFTKYQKPQLRIFNKEFRSTDNMVNSEAYGIVKNESNFEFGNISVNIILRDSDGSPIALNMTSVQTVRPQEERDFKVTWPYELEGDVVGVDMEAEANVYDSDNYTQSYLKGGSDPLR